MALDGVLLRGIALELNAVLAGARMDKVLQPERDELHLLLRAAGENVRLLLSASANHARVQLTGVTKQNPAEPPVFCMLLRKHLAGGRVLALRQEGLDRVLHIDIQNKDELGDAVTFTLTTEMMGRHSNIILHRDGRIVDSIKRIPVSISRVREVLPGLPYMQAPGQQKQNPMEVADAEGFFSLLDSAQEDVPVERAISNLLSGVGGGTAAEIAHIAQVEGIMGNLTIASRTRLARAMQAFFAPLREGTYAPTLLLDEGGIPKDVLPQPYTMFAPERMKAQPSLWQAMDALYAGRDRAERSRQRGQTLTRQLGQALSRAQNKLALQLQTLQDEQQMETLRIQGELLTANLYRAQKGMKTLEVDNYYQPGETMTIALDIRKNPSENAQALFKRYAKLRTAIARAAQEAPQTRQEVDYLQGQLVNVEQCISEAELLEIREELIREGVLRPDRDRRKKAAKKQPPPSQPLSVMLPGGIPAFVGRNNQQNDRLTLHTAAPEDTWLHVKDAPGSHVIIKSAQPSQDALEAAAMLAAHYSSLKTSANVPVDYTLRKYVKKPSGAKPGMVIYTHQRTLYVTPDVAAIQRMERGEGSE